MWTGHIPPHTRLKEMSQVPASAAQPPPARWHPHWGESEVLSLGQHFLNTHPVQAGFQALRGGGHTDKLTFNETDTWDTPATRGQGPTSCPPSCSGAQSLWCLLPNGAFQCNVDNGKAMAEWSRAQTQEQGGLRLCVPSGWWLNHSVRVSSSKHRGECVPPRVNTARGS